jgi:hypothetical protein
MEEIKKILPVPGPMRTMDREPVLYVCSFETSAQEYEVRITRCHNPEYHKLINLPCGNLKITNLKLAP